MDKILARFKDIDFLELCEIYRELSTSLYTPDFYDTLVEIYNERNEFNNVQILIEG